jgi:hypothetical protein
VCLQEDQADLIAAELSLGRPPLARPPCQVLAKGFETRSDDVCLGGIEKRRAKETPGACKIAGDC